MNWITIVGVRPYDGRYEFDLGNQELTTREWGWIKRHTGYLPLTLEEEFRGSDPELYAIFAVIAIRRAGKIDQGEVPALFERICDAPFGATIRMEFDDDVEEEDADSPPPESSTGKRFNAVSGNLVSSHNSANRDSICARGFCKCRAISVTLSRAVKCGKSPPSWMT